MLRGLSTVSFFAEDVQSASDWYQELLGVEPYFVRPEQGPPAYVEFRIGDMQHELGIMDRRFATSGDPGKATGAVVYWHVDAVHAAFNRLLSLGATRHGEPVERGPGFITASVIDPFGNILGVMFNRHFLDMVTR